MATTCFQTSRILLSFYCLASNFESLWCVVATLLKSEQSMGHKVHPRSKNLIQYLAITTTINLVKEAESLPQGFA